MTTELENAYAAGVFDGEGTIYIGKSGRLNLAVAMTDYETVLALKKMYGGFFGGYDIESGRVSYQWRTTGQLTIDVANAMFDYSIAKKKQLEVVLRFAEKFPPRGSEDRQRDPKTGRWSQQETEAETTYRNIASQQLIALKAPSVEGVTLDIETMGLQPETLQMLSCSYLVGNNEMGVTVSLLDTPMDDSSLLVATRDRLESYPFTLGWNSSRFDIPYINKRLALIGEREMFLGCHIDVDVMYDQHFGNNKRTSLVNAANHLGVTDEEVKKTPIDWALWNMALACEPEGLTYVAEHAKMDVILTRRIYDVLLGL